MNKITVSNTHWKYVGIFMFLILDALITNAQDKKVDINIGIHKETAWYQHPWAWVLGAAIFILLLVALLRSGKK